MCVISFLSKIQRASFSSEAQFENSSHWSHRLSDLHVHSLYCHLSFPQKAGVISVVVPVGIVWTLTHLHDISLKLPGKNVITMDQLPDGSEWNSDFFGYTHSCNDIITSLGWNAGGGLQGCDGESQDLINTAQSWKPSWFPCRWFFFFNLIYGSTNMTSAPTSLPPSPSSAFFLCLSCWPSSNTPYNSHVCIIFPSGCLSLAPGRKFHDGQDLCLSGSRPEWFQSLQEGTDLWSLW